MTCAACGADLKAECYWLRYGERVATCQVCGVTAPAQQEQRVSAGPAVIDDTLPGGARWIQNMGHEPVWIETKTEYRRELDRRGLVNQPSGRENKQDRSPWATRTRLR